MGDGGGLSGETRYSVESLLYYAPRFIGVGETLAAAAESAEKRLLGLGSFWGSSSPDKAFAASYPPSQYALLIVIQQLATELQGIGGGIELMAKKYAITEEDIKDDFQRIGRAVGQQNALLHHTGGLPPPADAPPVPPVQLTTAPNPAPQRSPAPPAPSAQRHTPSPQQRRPVPSAPHPSPGAAPDPEAWKWATPTSLIGPWPSGDPERMDEAAAAWKALAGALDTAWGDAQKYTSYVLSDNQDAAADAFSDTVEELIDPNKGTLTRALWACEQMQGVCTNQAQAIRDIKHELEALLVEVVASIVIGQIVSAITFETTEAAAVAISAGLAGRITFIVARFTRGVIQLSETMEAAVAEVIAKTVVSGGVGLTTAAVGIPVNNAISEAFGQNPTEGTTALKQILESGGLAALGGTFTASAGVMSNTLRNLSEQGGPASSTLMTLSRQLKSGSITVAAASGTLQELLRSGQVDPVRYISAVTSARLQTALQPHTGKHAH